MHCVPLLHLSTTVPPRPAHRELQADCEPLCSAPAPVPAPQPGTTVPPAELSAEPETGTGNELASQSENSGPVPERRKKKTKEPGEAIVALCLRASLNLLSSIRGSDSERNKTSFENLQSLYCVLKMSNSV